MTETKIDELQSNLKWITEELWRTENKLQNTEKILGEKSTSTSSQLQKTSHSVDSVVERRMMKRRRIMKKELTLEDLTTIISRFSSSMHKLKSSGDYPESTRDKIILRKLTDMQWEERKKKESWRKID